MERSIIAMADRYYENYTYRKVTKSRTVGGKVVETTEDYTDCPLVFVQPQGRGNWTQDGILNEKQAKVHIASRFFEVNTFTPSLNDKIVKGNEIYRITDIKDYTYHPHINVYTMTIKKVR